jgi:hypothetical protein
VNYENSMVVVSTDSALIDSFFPHSCLRSTWVSSLRLLGSSGSRMWYFSHILSVWIPRLRLNISALVSSPLIPFPASLYLVITCEKQRQHFLLDSSLFTCSGYAGVGYAHDLGLCLDTFLVLFAVFLFFTATSLHNSFFCMIPFACSFCLARRCRDLDAKRAKRKI